MEDCALLLGLIAGHDPHDALTAKRPVPDYVRALAGGVRGLRVGVIRELTSGPETDPEVRDAVTAAGGPADVTVVCVDVPGCEGGAILATAERGTVIFFSMATSFSAAALGAEGLAADVRMLVGNGYTPGHAAYALELLRADAGVRGLFERRL